MNDSTKNFAGEIFPEWSAEAGVAFECAREYVSELIAIQSRLLALEKAKHAPDASAISRLQQEQRQLSEERASLKVQDKEAVSRIRQEYGARIRAWHEQQIKQHQ